MFGSKKPVSKKQGMAAAACLQPRKAAAPAAGAAGLAFDPCLLRLRKSPPRWAGQALNKAALLLGLALWAPACSHLSDRSIDRVPYYAQKSEILDRLGSPFQIRRKKGLDLWIYKLKSGGREYTRTLVFKDGRFLRAEKPVDYPPAAPLFEEAESFEQYEKAVEYIRGQKKR